MTKSAIKTEKVSAPRKSRAKKTNVPVVIITESEAEALLDHAAETAEVDLAAAVVATKRRVKSAKERGEDGRVVRKGRNLSGNQPFRRKHYFYDLDAKDVAGYQAAFDKAPMQVRLMMRYMEDQGITTEDDAEIGSEICGGAINSGALQSKIDPAALFAYYRRVMERLGLTLGAEG